MESEENSQKYYRLLNSKDKTNNEMMILCSLAKVENSIKDLEDNPKVDEATKKLWRATGNAWMNRMNDLLDVEGWK